MSEQKKQKKQFWIILFIVFLGFLGISLPYLIFPALFLNPDYSILSADWGESSRMLLLGGTLAAYPLGQFLGSPILGSLSDDYGRKKLLATSLLLAALCNTLTGVAIAWQHLGLLIVSRFAAGIMEGNIAIARAMAADLSEITKHEAFGKINAASSIAYLIGPLLGGLMTEKELFEGFTTATPFYLAGIFFLFLAGLTAIVMESAPFSLPAEKRSFWQRINLVKRLTLLFSNKRLQFLMILSTWFTLAVDIYYEFGPIYLTVKWELSPAQLVIYNGLLCLGLAIGNGWLPSVAVSRLSNRSAIFYSIGGFALFVIGMVLTDTPLLMMLLFTLSGLVIGLAVTLITVKISDSVPDNIQGEVMGVQLSLRVLGDAAICLLGGLLLLLSSKLILAISAAMAFALMAYYWYKSR